MRIESTQPYFDQKPGTAGLRKKVRVFQQKNYLENFLQASFDAMPPLHRLILGGDGRYYNDVALQTAIRVALGNGVKEIIVAQHGLLSTPAASFLIRDCHADGGFIFSASHNPAGPEEDFGIKFNIANGGQAPESLTDRIFQLSKAVENYKILDIPELDLTQIQDHVFGEATVRVVDGIRPYGKYLSQFFDFDLMRVWLKNHRVVFDAMHAVTGPYARYLLNELLGAPLDSVRNAVPLPDFGGGHPDPNLIYAADLVAELFSDNAPDLGAASDGDGDRNMILGKNTFISPGDSLAMLAANLHLLPGYRQISGVARSMPTCRALDKVAESLALPCFETPTGWKFFCNLLDADRITLCGEESFGTGSMHVREKDGLWAVMAWINVLAVRQVSVAELAAQHWARYGRHYYCRHDYEGLSNAQAEGILSRALALFPTWQGQVFNGLLLEQADSFSYLDPIDGSLSQNQGLRLVFGDSARIIVRLSGTGTSGATLRLYLERYEQQDLALPTATALQALADLAEQLLQICTLSGKTAPDVVT
jgi:phosphoglucomutase